MKFTYLSNLLNSSLHKNLIPSIFIYIDYNISYFSYVYKYIMLEVKICIVQYLEICLSFTQKAVALRRVANVDHMLFKN